MDFYDYSALKSLHALMAFVAIGLFGARGLPLLGGARWPRDSRLRVIHGAVVFLLVVSGISLWGVLSISPVHHSWLAAKMVLTAVYGLLAWGTFDEDTPDGLRALSFLLGLLCALVLVRVGQTRDPLFGLG